jgi:hypothetical protein
VGQLGSGSSKTSSAWYKSNRPETNYHQGPNFSL